MLDYLSALWNHWVALMSGVVGLLAVLGLRIGRQFSVDLSRWSDLPDWLFTCLGVTCVFVAGYAAWNDVRQALVALQKRLGSPEFTGELAQTITSPIGSRGQDLLMIVTGSITNRFGPSSAIMDWSLSLVFPDGHAVKGVVPLWNHEDFHLFTAAAPERELILNAKDYWPIKESNSPIPAGGVRCGWFWAVFQDTAQSTLSEVHPRVVLGFGDAINRRRHEISLVADYKLGDPIALDDLRNR